ncbi:hypothetical protein KJ657_03990 [Patescibacteria group bacterium]|nr:hypothetical protein [Patescibacteria group bacterium]MBU1016225.1 hypothetical protein [Patescibacteria group bacterium]
MLDKKSLKQVENALNALFKKYKIQDKVDVETIKKWIWNAKGEGIEPVNKYQKKCFQIFPEPEDIDEMNDILQVFVDAWNHFPHKELGRKAPCDRDALPKYKKYLGQLIKGKKRQVDYYDVAHIFFERALHLGFVDLASIRPAFIQEEFPAWWPTHVMYSNYKPAQVRKALETLFMFLALVYKVEPIKYGF